MTEINKDNNKSHIMMNISFTNIKGIKVDKCVECELDWLWSKYELTSDILLNILGLDNRTGHILEILYSTKDISKCGVFSVTKSSYTPTTLTSTGDPNFVAHGFISIISYTDFNLVIEEVTHPPGVLMMHAQCRNT